MSISTLGRGQPQLHQRQQRVAAGQHLGVVAVLGEERQRLVDRARPLDVVERCGDHACSPCACGTWPARRTGLAAAARTARTMLW